jgi:hypothetical protein
VCKCHKQYEKELLVISSATRVGTHFLRETNFCRKYLLKVHKYTVSSLAFICRPFLGFSSRGFFSHGFSSHGFSSRGFSSRGFSSRGFFLMGFPSVTYGLLIIFANNGE